MKKKPLVSIVMGSDSDLPVMKEAVATLEKFEISYEIKILSAHRCPDKTGLYAKSAAKNGIMVIIAAAGGAAHLAGVMASHSTLPVVGVPMNSQLDGLDSLLSTVQMPSGVPVATVAIGKAGAINAAILAVQIIGLTSKAVSGRIAKHKKDLVEKIDEKNRKLEKTLGGRGIDNSPTDLKRKR